MALHARVHVTLKTGVRDPQGEAVRQAFTVFGFGGGDEVRQGKVLDLTLATDDRASAEAEVQAMCEKLLANTVIETYAIEFP